MKFEDHSGHNHVTVWLGKVLKLKEEILGPEHPDTLSSRNDLAWFLATCPDAKIRTGSEAMALATNVCELSRWSDAEYLNTLAAAEAEAGLFDAAVKREQQALELAKASKVDVKDLKAAFPYTSSPSRIEPLPNTERKSTPTSRIMSNNSRVERASRFDTKQIESPRFLVLYHAPT